MENSACIANDMADPAHAIPLGLVDISGLAFKAQILNLANYVVLILAILKIPKLIAALITQPLMGNFIIVPVSIVLYTFCGWTIWNASNSLDAVASRYIIPSLLVVLALLVSLPIGFAYTLWYDLLCFPAAIVAIVMVTLLRRARLPGSNQRLDHILRHGLVRLPGPAVAPARRWWSYIFLAAAMLWLLACSFLTLDQISVDHNSLRGASLLYTIGFFLLILARRFWQPNYEAVMHSDSRPPFLFLRSFEDDRNATSGLSHIGSVSYGLFGYSFYNYSLESKLAIHFSRFGPFLAPAAPKNNPMLGAVRVKLPNETWQNTITRLLDAAKLIILYVGVGKGLSWEIEQIMSSGKACKTLLLFPQLAQRLRRKPANAAARLSSIVASLQGTIWGPPASTLERSCKPPELIRAILCASDSLVAITSKTPFRESCYVAAVLAHYMMQGRDESESAGLRQAHNALDDSALGRPASLSARLLAAMLDAVLLYAAWVTLDLILVPGPIVDLVGAFLFVLGYYFVLEGSVGSTIGKIIVNTAVVSTKGQSCSLRASAVRNLLRFVDIISLYYVWVAIAKSSAFSQRLGDRFAKTVVVRKRRPVALRALLAVFVFIVLGVCSDVVIKNINMNMNMLKPYIAAHVAIGLNDEVYYDRSIKQQTALALGDALKTAGVFMDKGATVFLENDAGEPVVSFVLKEGAWQDEDTNFTFERVGLQIAYSVGGPPIKVRLMDGSLKSKTELAVGRATVGIHDEIDYLGSATESDAKAMGEVFRRIRFFRDEGARVLLSRGKRTIISFVAKEGAWNERRSVSRLLDIARQAAPATGGLPVTVYICDYSLDPMKGFTVR